MEVEADVGTLESEVGDDLARHVDVDEAGYGDLDVHQPVGIDGEMVLRAGDPRRQVGGGEVGHAVSCDQPVERGEVDAHLPLLGADPVLQGDRKSTRLNSSP